MAPVKVVASAECTRCQEDLGWFVYEHEGALEINTTNLKNVPDSLSELIISMISRQLRKLLGPGGKRVQCCSCGSFGASVSKITISNLSVPPVLLLGFLVKGHGSQTVKCKVEENLNFGTAEFGLTAAVLSKPMHFVAVSKLKDNFFNLDNLDDIYNENMQQQIPTSKT